MTEPRPLQALRHDLATAALIAFEMARIDGESKRATYAENQFLLLWFKRAQKRKLFDRALAADIDVLIRYTSKNLAKQPVMAQLRRMLMPSLQDDPTGSSVPLWHRVLACSQAWQNAGFQVELPVSHDATKDGPYDPKAATVFTVPFQHDLIGSDGHLLGPISLLVAGELAPVVEILYQHDVIPVLHSQSEGNDKTAGLTCYEMHLYPHNVLPLNLIPIQEPSQARAR
ncbi:DUF2913 family protein [Ferrimonas marina]|nr:DUF2913 family protein [Ferrimonas marina]